MSEEYYLITFKSTHDVLKLDKEMVRGGYKTTIMPVPRDISYSCGLAIKVTANEIEDVKKSIKEKNLLYESMYKISEYNRNKIIKKLNGLES